MEALIPPKFGLVYQPLIDNLSLFANYMNGFNNVAPRPVIDADGNNQGIRTFEPEQANQLELGVKTNLFSDRISSTISYYDITVSNKIMSDGLNSVQGGEVKSKGYEISVNANPLAGLNVIGGYSFNESVVVEGESSSSFAEKGRRPAEAGPQNVFNAWVVYNFLKGPLKGFGLGFGGNSASERLIMDSEAIGKFVLPAYTVLNASLFYNADVFRLTIKVDNLGNEEYYKGWSTINPQRPGSVSASFAYRF
jgi:iron complex outermembrane receptor protein